MTAQINTDNISIENNMLSGIVITDQFSVRLNSGADHVVDATWTVNIPLNVAIQRLWGDTKVKMRAATLSKMTSAELDAMKGNSFEVLDYMTAKSETATAQVKALTNKLNTARDTAVRMFMDKALKMAIEELDAEATLLEQSTLGARMFDEQFAPIINEMYPV